MYCVEANLTIAIQAALSMPIPFLGINFLCVIPTITDRKLSPGTNLDGYRTIHYLALREGDESPDTVYRRLAQNAVKSQVAHTQNNREWHGCVIFGRSSCYCTDMACRIGEYSDHRANKDPARYTEIRFAS